VVRRQVGSELKRKYIRLGSDEESGVGMFDDTMVQSEGLKVEPHGGCYSLPRIAGRGGKVCRGEFRQGREQDGLVWISPCHKRARYVPPVEGPNGDF
jgi:hypothetical protein